MKASRFFIGTLKEAPADAEIVSHKLMMRAGMIRRVAGGIYDYMPIGLRSVRKVEAIVREEMNRAGALELLMPAVQPAELWQESGRWEQYGPELLRFKDRHERDFVIGPTHEEVVTDIARREIKSYRQLPVNLYQIQTKFRDEIRPRFGVMRGREFIMKDAYSFDKDRDGLAESYRKMYEAYVRIFTRIGLEFRAVAADNGSIGGSGSHEFHVIADTGEDDIAYCPSSDFAANVEAADALPLIAQRAAPTEELKKTPTPGAAKCEAVAQLLNIPLETHDQVDHSRNRQRRRRAHDLAADAARRSFAQRHQDEQAAGPRGLSLRDGSRDRRMVRHAAGLSRPDRHEEAGARDRGSHGREHERLRRRHERGRLPHDRRELGPRSARAGSGGYPQRRRGRSVAGRQGHARNLPWHRSGPRVPARHEVFGFDGRDASSTKTASPRRCRWAATASA